MFERQMVGFNNAVAWLLPLSLLFLRNREKKQERARERKKNKKKEK
jgi:hypothetical protein